jgi:hypothetical protein
LFVGWLVGCLACLASWLMWLSGLYFCFWVVVWLVGWLVGWAMSVLIVWLVGWCGLVCLFVCWLVGWLVGLMGLLLLLWTVKLLLSLCLCWFVLGWLTRLSYVGVAVREVLRAVGGRLEKWFQVDVVNQSLSRILHCLIQHKLCLQHVLLCAWAWLVGWLVDWLSH